jgi:hypothetical protein
MAPQTPFSPVLRWISLLLAVLLGSTVISTIFVMRCAPESPAEPYAVVKPDSVVSDSASQIKVAMRKVNYHLDDDIVLELRYLKGEFIPQEKKPPIFEDPATYHLRIRSATIAIDTLSLSKLLNRHVLGYKGAPIRDLHIRVEKDEIVQRGKMGAVTFTIRSKPSVNEDGRIRLHPTDVKVLGLSVEGLMKTFGVTLEKSLHLKEDRGLSIDKNDLLLDPAKMLPPPRISGRLRAIELEPDRLVQHFGGPDSLAPLSYFGGDHPASNYMHYHGGTMQFGRLTMTPLDLLLIDSDPSDLFEFSLTHYHQQLVAGTHRTTPEDALVVFMPDYPAPSISTR